MSTFFRRFDAVFRREVRLIRHRPIYIMGSVGALLLSTVFFLTFLQEGTPQDLPIGVVDYDHSSTSRNFAQQLDATQLGRVVRFEDVHEASRALETGRIYGMVVIPEGFNNDVQAFRRPYMTVYANPMYAIGGALSYKDLMFMVNLTNGAVQRQLLRGHGVPDEEIMARIQPLVIDAHMVGNPTLSYGVYLNNTLLPGVLGMCIVLLLVYSLGAELKFGTSQHLLRTSGDSIHLTVLAKLTPYTVLFTALGVILELILYGWMHYPMAGSIGNMILAVLAMVLAYEGVAVFIIGLMPNLRLAVSISALYSVMGFSMAGFTLPISSLPAAVQGLSYAFPLRQYYQIFVREAIYGTGIGGWYPYLLFLFLYMLLPLLTARRLHGAYKYQNYPRN